jgi:hypothetical protein
MLFDVNVKLVFHNATHATYLQLFCENATVFDSFTLVHTGPSSGDSQKGQSRIKGPCEIILDKVNR